MPRSPRSRLRESDLSPDVRARLAARRAESETPEYQARHAEEVARLQGEFPPLEHDESLLEALATLRQERERQGLTLSDVSSLCGIDPTTISKLENGRLPNPTCSTLRAYARALDMVVGWTVQRSPWKIEIFGDGYGVPYIMAPSEDAGSLYEYLLSSGIDCQPPADGSSVGGYTCNTISIDPAVNMKQVRRLVSRWKILTQSQRSTTSRSEA